MASRTRTILFHQIRANLYPTKTPHPATTEEWVVARYLNQLRREYASAERAIDLLENALHDKRLAVFGNMEVDVSPTQRTLSDFVFLLRSVPTNLTSEGDVTATRNILKRYNEKAEQLVVRLRSLLNRDEKYALHLDEMAHSPLFESHREAVQQELISDETERLIDERELGIERITNDVATVATIFRDMQTIVLDQSTMLDNIEANLTQTVTHLESANVRHNIIRKSTETNAVIVSSLLHLLLLFLLLHWWCTNLCNTSRQSCGTTGPFGILDANRRIQTRQENKQI